MSINSGQPSLSSSSSSIKLVQQHVKSFIQNLSSQELLLLLETFNQSHQINRSCKMVQYKCFESKIELDGKIGCGFGRSQEEAIAMSVKDFFDVILLEDKYLYLVQECFKQMKTQQQKEQTKQQEPILSQGILSEKVEDSQRNQQSQQNLKQLSDIEPSNNINFDDDNITRLLISSSLAEIEGTNEESQYMSGHDELQRKIGNISVINAGNAISSQATNNNINNSHADIDEMLLKIVFGDENKNNKEDNKGNHNNIQPIKNKQIILKTNNPPICSSPPLTQFQIYQMQQLQLQQQQQQQQQSNSKSSQLFPQNYNQIITKKSSMQTPPRKRHFSSSSGCNTFNNTNSQSTVPQQLNDTAFLPITKKTTTTTNNNMNPSKINQQLIQTNQVQPLQIENKENAFAVNQQIVNKQQFSNTISTCSGQLSRNNSKNQLARDVYSSEQAQGVSGINNQQHQLSVCRGNSSCCSHKEDLDRERQKTENLEKRIKLLMEENKILKSLLFDNEENVKGNSYSSNRNNQNINQGITQDIMLISKEKVSEDKGSNSDKPDNKNEKYGRSQSYGPTNLKGNKTAQQPGNNNNTSSNSNSINVAQSQQNNNQTQNRTIDSQFVFDQQSQMNISSQNPLSSVKKPIPKLNLEVLPNYHGKIVFKNLSNKQGNIMCNSESH